MSDPNTNLAEQLLLDKISPEERAAYLGFISYVNTHLDHESTVITGGANRQHSRRSLELEATVYTPQPVDTIVFGRQEELDKDGKPSPVTEYELRHIAKPPFDSSETSLEILIANWSIVLVRHNDVRYYVNNTLSAPQKVALVNGVVAASAALLGETVQTA